MLHHLNREIMLIPRFVCAILAFLVHAHNVVHTAPMATSQKMIPDHANNIDSAALRSANTRPKAVGMGKGRYCRASSAMRRQPRSRSGRR